MHRARDRPGLRFAFAICLVELSRERLGLDLVCGREEVESIPRIAHPRCRVHARCDHEADIVFSEGRLIDAHHATEFLEPDTRGLAKNLEAICCDDTILSYERHHIGDGRESRHVEEPFLPSHGDLFAKFGSDSKYGAHEFPCGRRATKLGEGIRFALLLIVNHDRVGELVARQLVIGNNDLDAKFARTRDRPHISDANICRDDELRAALCELLYAFSIDAIPLFMPVWNVILEIRFSFFQKIVKQDSSRDAVAIIIAPHGDAFTAFDSGRKSLCGPSHILHQKRVMEVKVIRGVEKLLYLIFCLYSSPAE